MACIKSREIGNHLIFITSFISLSESLRMAATRSEGIPPASIALAFEIVASLAPSALPLALPSASSCAHFLLAIAHEKVPEKVVPLNTHLPAVGDMDHVETHPLPIKLLLPS